MTAYKDPKLGAIVIRLKQPIALMFVQGPETVSMLESIVRAINNHAMEINKMKGFHINPEDYEIYL